MESATWHQIIWLFAIAFAVALFSAAPHLAAAQVFSFTSADNPLTLTVDPQDPGPGESVTLTLSSRSDLQTAAISWYADGTLASSGTGRTTFTTAAGAAGKATVIKAVADYADGTSASTKTTLRPQVVNLLWEALSYAPPFYRGRALASPGTPVRIHADAQFGVPESSITYTWSVNGSILQSLSGPGASTITLAGPAQGRALAVSVTARADSGKLSGSGSTSIPAVQPVIDLYADNPLLGITYRTAIGNGASLASAQTTLVAEPYFIDAESSTDPGLAYSWDVNNNPVLADASSPSRLTLALSGGNTGSAAVALAIREGGQSVASGSWSVRIIPSSNSTVFTVTH